MTNSIMIVGAGPGIGRGRCGKFGREGWHVVLTSRSTLVSPVFQNPFRARSPRLDFCKPMRPTRSHCARRSLRTTACPAG